jgi:hypothetical protein
MDRRAHPVDLGARRRDCTTRVLACAACGFHERWPWPLGLAAIDCGRATCPRCGGALREADRGAPPGELAYEAAGSRDEDGL